MGFLAPAWLLLAAAAAVPLLLHLLRRRVGARLEFPAVRYLARAEREHSRRLRLRNLLLMAVRVLLLLLVALAAARPVARLAGAGHAPTALAIVLDNSLSTSAIVDGRPVLDRLRAAGSTALDDARADDRLWLVTADGQVLGGNAATLRDALARVEPLAGAGDLPGAVRRAAGLARASGLAARQVAVLTDGQATTWARPVAVADVDVALYAPALTPPVDRAVIGASARPARWAPAGAVEARLRPGADSAVYRIGVQTGDGSVVTLARGTAAAAAGGETTVSARVAPSERGWLAGVVELEPDELRGDDRRWFAAWSGPAPAVAAAGNTGAFARAAVDAVVASGRGRPGGDVLVSPADEAARLPAVLLAPVNPVNVGAANRALERLGVPWRFGGRRGESGDARAAAGAPPIGDGAAVLQRYALELRAGAAADTLALAGGAPWIVAGAGYVLVASPLVPQATTFPLRAAFAPWLADVVTQRLAGDAGPIVQAAPGDSLRRPAWATALEAPDGRRTALSGAVLRAPTAAGVYFLLRDARRAGALVVNPETEETVLDRLPLAQLRERVMGARTRGSADAAQWRAALFDTSGGRPLAAPLLALALALLAAEAALTRAPRRVA